MGSRGLAFWGVLMLSCTIVIRQVLGDWTIVATLQETYGEGLEPLQARSHYTFPLTGPEWDADPLGAVLSALGRWSGMTTEGHPWGSALSRQTPQGWTVVGGSGGGEDEGPEGTWQT